MNILEKILLSVAFILLLSVTQSLYAYTNNDRFSISRQMPSHASICEIITVSITIAVADTPGYPIRGLYFSDEIPVDFTIDSSRVLLNGKAVSEIIQEKGSANEIYPYSYPLRWILEVPPAFSENNPLSSSDELTINYQFKIPNGIVLGTSYTFSGYAWAGCILNNPVEYVFGHENLPETTITIVSDVCKCYANFNYPTDLQVTGQDLIIYKQEYGRNDCSPSDPCYADGNGDGKVTGLDLNLFKNEYGRFDCPALP